MARRLESGPALPSPPGFEFGLRQNGAVTNRARGGLGAEWRRDTRRRSRWSFPCAARSRRAHRHRRRHQCRRRNGGGGRLGTRLRCDGASHRDGLRHNVEATGPFPWFLFCPARGSTIVFTACCGETQIEDLWLPFFAVSANLTRASIQVHRRGPLLKSLLASMRVPAVYPPILWDGDLLVDGGIIDNVPVDIMRGYAKLRYGDRLGRLLRVAPLRVCRLWRSDFGLASPGTALQTGFEEGPLSRYLEPSDANHRTQQHVSQKRNKQDGRSLP